MKLEPAKTYELYDTDYGKCIVKIETSLNESHDYFINIEGMVGVSKAELLEIAKFITEVADDLPLPRM